ncbi:MAG: hypothetical protein H6709_10930 [Kofleriaceae bacterium]|nr:hypothetical protein [Kofleriaceae bacterium]
MRLAHAMSSRFPGSRVRDTGRGASFIFEIDGAWLDARIREAPLVEIFVRTIDLWGTTLRLRPRDRTVELTLAGSLRTGNGERPPDFDAAVARAVAATRPAWTFADYEVDDDGPLAAIWLDAPARDALTAALWPVAVDGLLGPRAAASAYLCDVADGEVCLRRDSEFELDRFEAALRAGGTVAARPYRIGAAWLDAARELGGTTTAERWDVGGDFAATLERGGTSIRIDSVVRLPHEDADAARLRARLTARRVVPEGDAWALWRNHLGRDLRPEVPRRARAVDGLPAALAAGYDARATAPDRLAARLEHLAPLLLDAGIEAAWASGDEVVLIWDGLLPARDRLGAGAEVASRLAFEVDDAAAGPYR